MKGIIALVFAALLLAPAALAEEEIAAGVEEVAIEGTGGTAPDSILYGLDVALDNISLMLTFDPEAKARRGLEIAHERLLEVREMVRERKLEAARTAQREHANALATANAAVESVETDGKEETAENALRVTARIQERIESHQEFASVIKEKLAELSPEDRAAVEELFGEVVANAAQVKVKIMAKKDSAKLKFKAITEKLDAELEEAVAEIEEDAGLTEGRKERVKRMLARAKRALEGASEEVASEELVEEPEAEELEEGVADAEDALSEAEELSAEESYEEI